ncbi:MFS transporter [Nonomuraea roseoviolacea]|uniref:MFS family permease n=1 Tax=Nonomuraea roseoviolacea subsp. carminata TaxID=160689 RepID=A0ABT1KAZ4_9ACTN|nr:MFS transporter [Nonomuraea roseoviolacea]MCP2351173.1 MFS family permease [Nonomuraea roseoviolacea subsp. carminata]
MPHHPGGPHPGGLHPDSLHPDSLRHDTLRHGDPARRRRWAGLVALLVAEAMNLLDATIVTVAAPVVHADLGGDASAIPWFNAAYTLPFAVLLITGGRLGDLAGRRRVFALGVAGFALASAACALAPGVGTLVGLRAVQGAAAALVIPQTIGLIRAMFDGRDLARAMGSIGPVMGLAAVAGPVLGAVLTHADLFGSSWRAAFLVNLPLAAAVLAAVPLLPGRRTPDEAAREASGGTTRKASDGTTRAASAGAARPRLDGTGTVLAALGTGLVVFPLIQGDAAGGPARGWAMAVAGVALLVGFAFQQRRRARAGRAGLVEASLFRDRGFPAALATSALFFAAMNGLSLVVVLEVQLGLGQDVLTAGLALLPWSAAMGLASWVAGASLVPRYGRRVMFAGPAVMLTGLAVTVIAYRPSATAATLGIVAAGLAVAGAGNGLFTTPFFTAALSRVRPHETGSAAGLLNAVQQAGSTLGTAVLGGVYLRALAAGSGWAGAGHVAAARWAFLLGAGLLAATVVAAALMRVVRPGPDRVPMESNQALARQAGEG